LFVGGKLRCPHDKQLRHLNAYKAFEVKEQFQRELNVVLKCGACGHVFSPALEPAEMVAVQEALAA
jgi:hypothetical protein